MKRTIQKVAVLGSGIMGSRIACHFANTGVEVLLLDIMPNEAKDSTDHDIRNGIVNKFLHTTLKSNPSPVYSKKVAEKVITGNFNDDMHRIAQCDWIIEAVIERLDIKKQVFENVEKHRKPGTIITTNTSGIPVSMMLEGRSDDFQKHFCGTHFFNPPRYLKLLEIIPSAKTSPEVIDFLMHYGDLHLGKTMVLCKDTPGFISNRVGVYSIMSLFHITGELDLTVEEVDKLTGPVIGRPKSATFRTCDVVGLDTLVHVANGLHDHCPKDEARELFKLPEYVAKMVKNGWLGAKSEKGFYQKVKKDGESEIQVLDFKTLEYRSQKKSKFATLEITKPIDNLRERMKVLIAGKDKAGEFYRKSFLGLFAYVSQRIPEITDALYKVDSAMKAGFGWELGPFEAWEVLGVSDTLKKMEEAGQKPAPWIYDMLKSGKTSFYFVENGIKKYYDIESKSYLEVPGLKEFILLDNIRHSKTIWKNAGCTITDLDDGIINLEFHTKMNTIGSEVIEGIHKAITIAEKDFIGLVIANEGPNFSAGANVGMIFMMAAEQDYDELNLAVKTFQDTMMRIRYSSVPVVVAPHNLALGGGCEASMHADVVQVHAETYMGLVEFGIGLIPAGGGTKEFVIRLSDELKEGDIEVNNLRNRFLTIGQAKVSTSGEEAFELGYLRRGKDRLSINKDRQISDAKLSAIQLAEAGYTKPVPRKDIRVMGKQGLGIIYVGADSMHAGNYISEHDRKISEKLGYVMCGGDLSAPALVSEQYLLDLEREAFLSLCGEQKTLERIESLLKTGKILRN